MPLIHTLSELTPSFTYAPIYRSDPSTGKVIARGLRIRLPHS